MVRPATVARCSRCCLDDARAGRMRGAPPAPTVAPKTEAKPTEAPKPAARPPPPRGSGVAAARPPRRCATAASRLPPARSPVGASPSPAAAVDTVSGEVDAVDGRNVSVATAGVRRVRVADNASIMIEGQGSNEDLKPGVLVGITGKPVDVEVVRSSAGIAPKSRSSRGGPQAGSIMTKRQSSHLTARRRSRPGWREAHDHRDARDADRGRCRRRSPRSSRCAGHRCGTPKVICSSP